MNQILARIAHGRDREGVNPLDFQSRPATCASDAGADFFAGELASPEKKSLPCRFRARKSAGFQRNLRKRGAEGNLSPPPLESSRGPQPSRISIKRISAGNRLRFLQGVAVAGELAPPATLSLYAHHISPLLSKIITSFSMAIAFSRPSVGVIRLSSCSMEIIPS